MLWHGPSLCLGYKKEYSILDSEFGSVTEVPVPLEGTTPNILQINGVELLLGGQNALGIFINARGEPAINRQTIGWSETPKMTVRCKHYVAALLNDSIEVSSLLDQRVVQTVPFLQGISICAGSDCILVASESQVVTLKMTSIDDQVTQYLEQICISEALALLTESKPNASTLREFHSDAGLVLMNNLQFRDACNSFIRSSLDPREIITAFPDLRLKGVHYTPVHPRAVLFPSLRCCFNSISTGLCC